MKQTFLFIFFVALGIIGFRLIWNRTGNYDIDFITKLIGWILLIIWYCEETREDDPAKRPIGIPQ